MNAPLRLRALPLLLAVVLGVAGTRALAEVSVQVDDDGAYLGYHLLTNKSEKKTKIWTFSREGKKGLRPLNTDGDLHGDGYPVIEENLSGDGLPWVLWDRDIGSERRLVSTRWMPGGWDAIIEVDANVGGRQSEAALGFNSQGRPYLTFVRERADGTHEVRFSIFLFSRWAYSIPVSEEWEDAMGPSMNIVDDRTVEITFTLADGSTVTRTVHLPDTSTIHDDIYPFLQEEADVTEGVLG